MLRMNFQIQLYIPKGLPFSKKYDVADAFAIQDDWLNKENESDASEIGIYSISVLRNRLHRETGINSSRLKHDNRGKSHKIT